MSADQRLTAAREYLEYARKVHVADFPQSPLTRMAAELRRQLGQVLDVIGEDAPLTDTQREVLRQALGDAISWATQDDRCHVCEQSPTGLCPAHQAELDRRDSYIKLARELGIEVQS